MARNKEGLVLVIDVGPSMHAILPEVEKLCSLLAEKKLIYHKHDEVGVIAFGTSDTRNDLTEELGGYENVTVLRGIRRVVDGDLVDVLQQLPRGSVNGDFLDAVVVGIDMIVKKYKETKKGKKRLCLITDAINPTKGPSEETKEDQVKNLAAILMTRGMKMDYVVVRAKQEWDVDKKTVEENDSLLSLLTNKSSSNVYIESAISLLGAVRTRNILPVTIFRGDFELSSIMKIKVWVYKKTFEERFPTLKRYSDKAPPTDKFATHEVKIDYEYRTSDDSNKVVPPQQRIKGYRYGPHVVPISSTEWDAVKFKPEKGVKLLGFTDASNIKRHYYMKDVNLFIGEPGNTKAILAISALARAMKEVNKVAIIRCVWRNGQANVIIGVLTPNVSEKDTVPDSFYFNVLPFAEDVREFQFPSFSNLPSSMLPNERQQEAADKLVQMLDLAPPGKEEVLPPNLTPNPFLERFYRSLELRSKDPNANVPPIDETLKTMTEPDPELHLENRAVIEEFRRAFELKQNTKLKKSSRKTRDEPSGSSQAMEATEHTCT